MKTDTNKVIKGFIIGAIAFFLLIPIIIIALSYLPSFMLSSDSIAPSEYFKTNVLDNLGLKLVIATFVSFLLTAVGSLLVFSKTGKKNNK